MPQTRTRRRAALRGDGIVPPPGEPRTAARIDSDRPSTRAITSEGLVALSTRVAPSLKKRLKFAAIEHDINEQDIVAEALAEWFARRDPR